jgi:hypothetical protein
MPPLPFWPVLGSILVKNHVIFGVVFRMRFWMPFLLIFNDVGAVFERFLECLF